MNDAVIEITQRQLDSEKAQAVLGSKVKEFEKLLPEIFIRLTSLDKAVSHIPMQIVSCRDDMEENMNKYNHEKFITDRELSAFENKLEKQVTAELSKVTGKINKAIWVVSGFITAATFFNYIISHTTILHGG